MPKTKGLTLKQRKWIEAYIETGNATEAALIAYDCKDREVAGSIGSENLQKLALEEVMEEAGLSDSHLLKKLYKGLEANKVISANITYGDADEQTNDFIEVPDHTNRRGYLDMAFKLKDKYPREQVQNIQATKIEVIVPEAIAEKYGTPQSTKQDSQEQE